MSLAYAAGVAVRDDDDVAAREGLACAVRHGLPALGAERVARRDLAVLPKTVDVLFPLHDVHRRAHIARCEFVHLVEDAPDVAQYPGPATLAVGPTLAEILAHEPHDLEEQVAPLVDVVVARLDGARVELV